MTRLYRKRPRKPACSLCRRPTGETVVLHFALTRQEYVDGARLTMRGAGAIDLCEPCWVRATTAARIRRSFPRDRIAGLLGMTRRELAAVLVLLAIVLLLAALWPPSTRSDQPAVASRIPSSEFVPVRTAGPSSAVQAAARATLSRPLQPRTPSPTLPTAPAASVSPSASHALGTSTPVRVTAASATGSLAGTASWFASPIGVSAAGPALRAALGSGWRGVVVQVTANGRQVSTKLGDWCACPRRAIDLDAPVFAALAPLSQGLVEVSIEW